MPWIGMWASWNLRWNLLLKNYSSQSWI